MSKHDKPWEEVSDPRYFSRVLGSMVAIGFGPKHEGKAHVRFGNTGKGHAPNYQIDTVDGGKHCFMGLNHQEASEEEFDTDNLSQERFSYSQVQSMLGRRRGRGGH